MATNMKPTFTFFATENRLHVYRATHVSRRSLISRERCVYLAAQAVSAVGVPSMNAEHAPGSVTAEASRIMRTAGAARHDDVNALATFCSALFDPDRELPDSPVDQLVLCWSLRRLLTLMVLLTTKGGSPLNEHNTELYLTASATFLFDSDPLPAEYKVPGLRKLQIPTISKGRNADNTLSVAKFVAVIVAIASLDPFVWPAYREMLVAESAEAESSVTKAPKPTIQDRLDSLEATVASLRSEVDVLKGLLK